MTTEVWAFVALAGIVGLATGLLIGLWRTMALTREVALKDAELRSRAAADLERESAIALAGERLGAAFNQLADRQLHSHSETFLKLAHEALNVHTERAKGDLTAREQAIDNLVAPIREALARQERQLQELDKSRSETHGSNSKQLEALAASQLALSAETRNLVSALRRPEVRGQWGEITLRRLVELAGMVEHCDFVTQSHQATENGAVRPDMVVHLPEARDLIVDVKTPGFSRAAELWFAVQVPEIRAYLQLLIEQHGDRGIQRAMGFMLDGWRSPDGLPYMKALAARAGLVREWQLFFETTPLVLAPVSTEPVYERGFDLESAERSGRLWRECATLTGVPVLGIPGLAVATGMADGAPTGVQVLAPRFREDLCLAAAEVIESRSGLTPLLPTDIQW